MCWPTAQFASEIHTLVMCSDGYKRLHVLPFGDVEFGKESVSFVGDVAFGKAEILPKGEDMQKPSSNAPKDFLNNWDVLLNTELC